MNPSAKDIFDAIEAVPTDEVLLLPNNSNVILTAEQASSMSEKNVRVIPSKSVQAGLAAMTGFMSSNAPDDNERAMLAELASASTGEVTVASRDVDARRRRDTRRASTSASSTTGPSCPIPRSTSSCTRWSIASSPTDESVLTILTGEDAPALDGLLPAIEQRHPDLEVLDVHEGGQPHYPLLLVAQ